MDVLVFVLWAGGLLVLLRYGLTFMVGVLFLRHTPVFANFYGA